MPSLLIIQSSLFGSQGQSSQLTHEFATHWLNKHPHSAITIRNLAESPLPHLDEQRVTAFMTAAELRNDQQRAWVAESDALINEWRQADRVVIGLPLYNFGIPSTLKAYFDHIARAGETFRYTENGPQGLLKDRKTDVFATRGGLYADTPLDTQTQYVRHFLSFIGIHDVEFIYAEGLNMSDPHRQDALNNARQHITTLVA